MKYKYLSFDSEFKNSNEKFLTPVSAALRDEVNGAEYVYFMHNNKDEQDRFVTDFRNFISEGYIPVVFFASAETRFLLSVGFTNEELLSIKFFDIYPLWSMLQQNVIECAYGKMQVYDKETRDYIEVDTHEPTENEVEDGSFVIDEVTGEGKYFDNIYTRKYSRSLVDSVKCLLGENINSVWKDTMRDLILFSDIYNDEDIENIKNYNLSDIKYLTKLLKKAFSKVRELTDNDFKLRHLEELSQSMVVNGIIENNGIPVDFEKMETFSSNYDFLKDQIIENCNKTYPFFVKEKGRWVKKMDVFYDFVDSLGLNWDRTASGRYSMKDTVLENYQTIPEINVLRRTINNLANINRFEPKKFFKIKNNIGSDNRVRILSGAFGSITSRYQPSISNGWILGFSSWFRTLITADSDSVIIGADFSAQEIALQAVVADDSSFEESYLSNDPYTWFAQKSNIMKSDIYRKGGKYYDSKHNLLSDEEQIYNKSLRNLFKSVLLGVGYGMGAKKLADSLTSVKISNLSQDKYNIYLKSKVTNDYDILKQWNKIYEDTRIVSGYDDTRNYPEDQKSLTYINFHKSIFSSYWIFRQLTEERFKRTKHITLPDGWSLIKSLSKNSNKNTICNFPIQGRGAVILRRALKKCIENGLEVIAPHHDAIYIVSKKENAERDKELLKKLMKEASTEIIGSDIVRIDAEIYTTDWDNLSSVWTKEKGYLDLQLYGKYFLEKVKKGLFD